MALNGWLFDDVLPPQHYTGQLFPIIYGNENVFFYEQDVDVWYGWTPAMWRRVVESEIPTELLIKLLLLKG